MAMLTFAQQAEIERECAAALLDSLLREPGRKRTFAQELGYSGTYFAMLRSIDRHPDHPRSEARPFTDAFLRRVHNLALPRAVKDQLVHHIARSIALRRRGRVTRRPAARATADEVAHIDAALKHVRSALAPPAVGRALLMVQLHGEALLARLDPNTSTMDYLRLLFCLNDALIMTGEPTRALYYALEARDILTAPDVARHPAWKARLPELSIRALRAEGMPYRDLGLPRRAYACFQRAEELMLRHGADAALGYELCRDKLDALGDLPRFSIAEAELTAERGAPAQATAAAAPAKIALRARLGRCYLRHGNLKKAWWAYESLAKRGSTISTLPVRERVPVCRVFALLARAFGDARGCRYWGREGLTLAREAGLMQDYAAIVSDWTGRRGIMPALDPEHRPPLSSALLRSSIGLHALMALAILSAGCGDQPPSPPEATALPTVDPSPALAVPDTPGALVAAVPALAMREAGWRAILASGVPIMPLPEPLDDRGRAAQDIALADGRLQAASRDPGTGAPLRAEVMQVRPMLEADLSAATTACRAAECYRVEVFNHATNTTWRAAVDVGRGEVVALEAAPDTQPEIPPHLAELAAEIAAAAPEVAAALGGAPRAGDAGMPGVKTALNGSRCERSRHLCVAPTFVRGDRALWAIVDLTDGRLVGTRWTDLGRPAVALTEQSLQDEVVMSRYCAAPTALERDGWTMAYILTPSDGLEVKDARFRGRPALRSAKLVDWHVSYSGTDGFGYSDAVGCPKFSTASVVAFNGPLVEDIRQGDEVVGFAIVQDFRSELWPMACNYRYAQRFEFYRDGRFRVGGANLGRGCGNNGTYRPVLRIDVTAGGDGAADRVAEWDGRAWWAWDLEAWRLQGDDTPYTPEGYQLRIESPGGETYALEPNRGQLADGAAGDHAYTFITRRRPEEGEGDLLTIGPCCNEDHRQGPEKYMAEPEPIDGADLVIWYVPQLRNSDVPGAERCWADSAVEDGKAVATVHPCAFGLLFAPSAPPAASPPP